jgi:hypothetical protein
LSKSLFNNKWLIGLLPFYVLFTPFSGFVYLVWAEPLYMALFYWTVLYLYLFVKQPSLIKGLLLGMLVASLYYTKTASGLIAEMSFAITTCIYLINGRHKGLALFSLTVCVLSTLPWMIHYKQLGVSIIGYPVATDALISKLNSHVTDFFIDMLKSFFYQLSYVVIGTWATIGVCTTLLVTQWNKIDAPAQMLTLFLIVCITGLMMLNALGMVTVPGLDFRMCNGRYYSLLFPLLTIVTLHLLFKRHLEKKYLIMALIALLLTAIISYVATPLFTRNPFSFITMPDLASIIYLSDNGEFVWRAMIDKPSLALRLNVVLFFSTAAFLIIVFRNWRFSPFVATIIISTYVLCTGFSERYYIHGMAIGQSSLNTVYIRLIKSNIPIEQVGFDDTLKESNVKFLTPFWMNHPADFTSHRKYFVSQKDLALNKWFIFDNYKIYKQ